MHITINILLLISFASSITFLILFLKLSNDYIYHLSISVYVTVVLMTTSLWFCCCRKRDKEFREIQKVLKKTIKSNLNDGLKVTDGTLGDATLSDEEFVFVDKGDLDATLSDAGKAHTNEIMGGEQQHVFGDKKDKENTNESSINDEEYVFVDEKDTNDMLNDVEKTNTIETGTNVTDINKISRFEEEYLNVDKPSNNDSDNNQKNSNNVLTKVKNAETGEPEDIPNSRPIVADKLDNNKVTSDPNVADGGMFIPQSMSSDDNKVTDKVIENPSASPTGQPSEIEIPIKVTDKKKLSDEIIIETTENVDNTHTHEKHESLLDENENDNTSTGYKNEMPTDDTAVYENTKVVEEIKENAEETNEVVEEIEEAVEEYKEQKRYSDKRIRRIQFENNPFQNDTKKSIILDQIETCCQVIYKATEPINCTSLTGVDYKQRNSFLKSYSTEYINELELLYKQRREIHMRFYQDELERNFNPKYFADLKNLKEQETITKDFIDENRKNILTPLTACVVLQSCMMFLNLKLFGSSYTKNIPETEIQQCIELKRLYDEMDDYKREIVCYFVGFIRACETNTNLNNFKTFCSYCLLANYFTSDDDLEIIRMFREYNHYEIKKTENYLQWVNIERRN